LGKTPPPYKNQNTTPSPIQNYKIQLHPYIKLLPRTNPFNLLRRFFISYRKDGVFMTLTITELADKYNLTENTISKNFPKVKEKLEKKHGITIEKIGRGQSAQYVITDFEHSDPNRAVTLYKSMEKNKIPSVIAAGLLDLNFLIFIGIVSSP
jgi:hypothetical protein